MTVGSKPNEFNHISSHEVFQSFNDTDILNILAIDQHGTVVYANKAELALSGYIYDEYIGKPLKQFYSSESALQKIFKSIADSQELYNIESVLELKDGTCRNVLISTRNLQDDTGTGYTYLFVRDISTYKKNENLLSYLNTSTEALAGARDSKDALNKIADLIVPKFANWFTIDVLKGGKLELLKLAHENPEYVKIAADYRKNYPTDLNSDSATALVVRTGQPSFLPVITPEIIESSVPDPARRKIIQNLELHSVITVAMFSKEVITGVVTFISSTPGKYDEADLRFAQNFANHIGLALENTRLNEEAISEIEQRRKIEDELRRTQIQLKTALSSGLIGTWIRDFENDVTYVDENFCKIYGLEYSPNGIDPAVLINHIHPEERAVAELRKEKTLNMHLKRVKIVSA